MPLVWPKYNMFGYVFLYTTEFLESKSKGYMLASDVDEGHHMEKTSNKVEL